MNGSAPVAVVRPLLPREADAEPENHLITADDQLNLLENMEALFQGELFEDFNFEEVLNSEE